MKLEDTESLLLIGAVGIIGYLIYKAAGVGTAAANSVANAASDLSSSIADEAQSILGNGLAQPGGTYTVTMQDGSVQTVPYGQLPVQP